jgi:hypothetical protein
MKFIYNMSILKIKGKQIWSIDLSWFSRIVLTRISKICPIVMRILNS